MNALIRKEIRLILPAWALAMALAILPVWLFWPGLDAGQRFLPGPPDLAVVLPFGLGVLLLAVSSFGLEFSAGTFSSLLAQPVPRHRVWRVKTTLLALALCLAAVAFFWSYQVRVSSVIETALANIPLPARASFSVPFQQTRELAFLKAISAGAAFTLLAFAGGLWATLLFRQFAAALCVAFLAPMAISLVSQLLLLLPIPDLAVQLIGYGLLGIYVLWGVRYARKLFLAAQDAPWMGGAISLSSFAALGSGSSAQASSRQRQPLRALIRKEFQLQHVNLLIAGLLLLSHLVVIAVRKLNADYFALHRSAAMIWESWPILWLAMPVLIGGLAVAEERKLGTQEGLLCLPATRRREFCVKFAMVLCLGVLLGGVMPALVEHLSELIGLARKGSGEAVLSGWEVFSIAGISLLGSAGLVMVSFYASTLTRNLLQALGLATVLSLSALALLQGAVSMGGRDQFYMEPPLLWTAPLIGMIGWPVMIVTVLMLALGNFKQLNPGGKVWGRNLLTLLAALAGAAAVTTVVYHRSWELWIPKEPIPRSDRYDLFTWQRQLRQDSATNPFLRPKMEASLSRVAIVLPDGKLWLQQRDVKPVQWVNAGFTNHSWGPVGSWRSGFLEGSKWREVAVSLSAGFAIQADGSLWDLTGIQMGKNGSWSQPRQFGDGRDWKKLSAGAEHFVALKDDGTLWEWGKMFVPEGNSVRTETIAAPAQVGNDRDWTAVCGFEGGSLAAKSDGSLWLWGSFAAQPQRRLSLPGGQLVSLSANQSYVVAVCADGSAWIGGDLPDWFVDADKAKRTRHEMIQLGNSSDWVMVRVINYCDLVAIKRDGTLWRSQSWGREAWRYRTFVPAIVSDYADWIAVCRYGDAFLAVKDEGSLCLWGDPSGDPYHRLLMPSEIKATRIASLLK